MAKKYSLSDLYSNNKVINRIIAIAVFFIIAGAVFYHIVEKLNWVDAFYFTVVTLATVGYGDIAPHTNLGKIFTIFYILVGITIFLALARGILLKIVKKRIKR
jgi:voltage-gated potassium channel Kch